jgi:acyl carrier protein
MEVSGIDVSKSFLSYGLNSLQAMLMAGDLENALGLPLPPTLAWDYPCVADLTDHLAGLTAGASSAVSPSDDAPIHEAATPQVAVADLSDDQVDELLRQYMK